MEFMNKNNFVNVVGYQLEKVHTGVIKWIMDTANSNVSLREKLSVLERIYKFSDKEIPFNEQDIASIVCIPEFAFGRKRKIDLVIKITLKTNIKKYIVIEMKVDSIPYIEQLEGTFSDFTKEIDINNDNCFLLFLLGSSQVCQAPITKDFFVCNINDILHFFKDLNTNSNIYIDWIESLKEEQTRGNEIIDYLNHIDNLWNKNYWINNGYRTWFSLFYYLYNQLKAFSNQRDNWDIYSGSNNPVMNWLPGWNTIHYNNHPLTFYWEFNYEEFILKAKIDPDNPISKDDLSQLRNLITEICNSSSVIKGNKTRNTYGTYISIYKWKFNFKEQKFSDIMVSVEEILQNLPDKIITL